MIKIFLHSILAVLAVSFYATNTAVASTKCGVVINFPPGGTSDKYARLLQKTNPNWTVEYRVGAFATNAINLLENKKDYVYFGSPVMFGKNNPNKNPPVELYRILIGAPILSLTNTNLSIDDLFTKKVNIGVPSLGTAHHMIALQLKQNNPNIEIISTGGDNKALPILLNGDLDVYLISKTAGQQFVQNFGLKNLQEFKYGESVKFGSVEVESQGFNGLFFHKDATEVQRKAIKQCVDDSLADPRWKSELIESGADPVDYTGDKKDTLLKKYLNKMTEFNL